MKNSGTAEEILNHYQDADGTFESFRLPTRIFDGMDNDLESIIRDPAAISWRYAVPPQVQSVRPNMSTVTVRLIGELEV